MKNRKLPKCVYICWKDTSCGDEPYLLALDSPFDDDLEHNETIGVYELKSIKKVNVERSLK